MARPNKLKRTAHKMAEELIQVALHKRKWTKDESRQWDRAFTALQKLRA